MKFPKVAVFALVLFGVGVLHAQDKSRMQDYQSQLQQLFADIYESASDNERFYANEQVVRLFSEALMEENSIKWQWDFGRRASVLTSADKKFRVITWPVVNEVGEWECFGFLQALNEKSGEYDVYELRDMSEDIVNRQESTLAPDEWYGSVYQELITTSYEGKTYYTLLGWSGVDCLTQRKVIEPVLFKGGGSMPQFGQNVFRKERNLRRVVLEYTNTAMVTMRYEEQFVRSVEKVRAQRKSSSRSKTRRRGRKVLRNESAVKEKVVAGPSTKIRDEKMQMIIFDEVEPQVLGMEGLFQYYVPSGAELAYVFVNGKWELREGAQGRSTNKKLNKEFSPIEKKAPAYKVD